jgi:hypothetical protein
MPRFVLRLTPELRDVAAAAPLSKAVAKLAMRPLGERPVLTDAEAEQAIRAWVRCRARRWLDSGYDYEFDSNRDGRTTRAGLVAQLTDAILAGSEEVLKLQAVRSLGAGLSAAIEAEVATIVPDPAFVPAWARSARVEQTEREQLLAQAEARLAGQPAGPLPTDASLTGMVPATTPY